MDSFAVTVDLIDFRIQAVKFNGENREVAEWSHFRDFSGTRLTVVLKDKDKDKKDA